MTLIDEARDWWRLWSIRFGGLGLVLQVLDWFNRSGLLGVWNMMPLELRQALPPWLLQLVGAVLFGAALIARLIPQPRLQARVQEKRNAADPG